MCLIITFQHNKGILLIFKCLLDSQRFQELRLTFIVCMQTSKRTKCLNKHLSRKNASGSFTEETCTTRH